MLPDLGITVTEAAKQLGVTRVTFSKIINGKSGISPDMALRLAQWLGASPDSWLNCRLLMISGKRSNGHIRLLLLPEYNMYEGEQLNNSCLTQLQLPMVTRRSILNRLHCLVMMFEVLQILIV